MDTATKERIKNMKPGTVVTLQPGEILPQDFFPLSLSQGEKAVALVLDSAIRQGAEEDKPEGARFIVLSDTIAKKLAAIKERRVKTMSRKHRKPDAVQPIVEIKSVEAEDSAVAARLKALEENASGRMVPQSAAGECVMCRESRRLAGRVNYTEIYHTAGAVRYCRCRVCRWTWKIVG